MKEIIENLLQEAIDLKASDIFFFPKNNQYQVKVNVLGKGKIIKEYDMELGKQLINYLKYQANMMISERRRPQLGSWIYCDDKNQIFCRLSSVGDFLGNESLVLRLIFPNKVMNKNYFFDSQFENLKDACNSSGMIVFSGPMGSGKTTTMYNLAKNLSKEKQVMCIEDPIEIYEPNFLQIQVNSKAQMAYADLLKVSLRHHPDVIIIGEIRDEVTAKVAINAALSGQLILTTVHSRNVYGIYQRLKNLGISDNELRQTLKMISYQRLIPTNEGVGKVLFDQLKDESLENIFGNKLSRIRPTREWRKNLETCYFKGWIDKETYQSCLEG